MRTFERLLTSPASLLVVLAGDVLAGGVFGSVLVLLPLTRVALLTDASIASPLLLAAASLQVHSPLPHSRYC